MAIGVLLFVSGLEKVTAFQPMVIGSSLVVPGILVAAWGVIELLSGWALMALVGSRLLREWTTVMFLVFTIVLLVNWASGARQCQCLGSAGTSILTMLAIDLVILTWLYFYRDRWGRENASFYGIVGDVLGNAKWVTTGVLVAATLWFGSPSSAIGYLSGRSLLPDQSVIFAGQVGSGDQATATFHLRNVSATPIRILGARASCRCVAVDDLPLTVQPGQTKAIRISLSAGPLLGMQRETVLLFCDNKPTELLRERLPVLWEHQWIILLLWRSFGPTV